MEEALEHEDHCFDSIYDCNNNVWTGFEAVWPHEVHQMQHRNVAAQTCYTESQVLDNCGSRSMMCCTVQRLRLMQR